MLLGVITPFSLPLGLQSFRKVGFLTISFLIKNCSSHILTFEAAMLGKLALPYKKLPLPGSHMTVYQSLQSGSQI